MSKKIFILMIFCFIVSGCKNTEEKKDINYIPKIEKIPLKINLNEKKESYIEKKYTGHKTIFTAEEMKFTEYIFK